MAKVRMKVSAEAMAEAGKDRGDFVLPKPGFYVLTMTECNSGFSKTDGEEDKKKPRLECVYKITGVGREEAEPKELYGNIWDYVSFNEASAWKRADFLKAFGIASADSASEFDGEFDTDDLINRKVLVRLKHEKGRTKDDPSRAKVATMFVYGSDPGDIAEEGEVDYGETDEAFGETGTDEEPKYTEADLVAMDLKALGAVLTEVTGEAPQDYIVKKNGKTDTAATGKAVIEAILAAQGEDANVTEDDTDEDPF